MTAHPVEKTVTYATSVETMPEAWAFVMAHQDEFDRPRVTISPLTVFAAADFSQDHGEELFEVSVSGHQFVEAARDAS